MSDLHYTPEIEEFHVGFEYECKFHVTQDWFPDAVLTKDTFKDLLLTGVTGAYRVKYLDQEDIESFKFINDTNMEEKHKSWIFIGLEHFKIYTRNWRTFTITEGAVTDRIRFNGELKNISELKRVLKMIGYA